MLSSECIPPITAKQSIALPTGCRLLALGEFAKPGDYRYHEGIWQNNVSEKKIHKWSLLYARRNDP